MVETAVPAIHPGGGEGGRPGVFTAHAELRMRQRGISHQVALEVLRRGLLRRTPEPNIRFGTMECRMEYYIAGRNLGVVAAVSESDPGVVVVTTMELD